MAKIYPYGYFYRSSTDLTDASGNYNGNAFKIPLFLDTVILDGFSGSITSGNIILEKNSEKRYSLSVGAERELLVEPGDSFRILIEDGDASNLLYNYQLGFRDAQKSGDIEISESSSSSST